MSLNSREEAIALWLLVFFIWGMVKPDIRASFRRIVISLLSPPMLLPLLIMFVYIAGGVWLLSKINLWHWTNLKDTLIWTIVAVFALYFHSNEVSGERGFFRTKVVENIKLTAVVEFVINIYTFPFLIEIILMPLLVIFGIAVEFTKEKAEYRDVRRPLEWGLASIGFVILLPVIRYLGVNWSKVATFQTVIDFLLPFILTVMVLPFIYCFALLIEYETIFTRIDIFTPDKSVSRYAKRKIIRTCNIHLHRLHRFSKEIGIPKFRDYDDIEIRIHQLRTGLLSTKTFLTR